MSFFIACLLLVSVLLGAYGTNKEKKIKKKRIGCLRHKQRIKAFLVE